MSENGDMPAMPVECQFGPDDKVRGQQTGNYSGWEIGLTKREYATIHLAAAWVKALSARRGEPGYDDDGCAMHANSMACFQVDHLLAELAKKGGGE